MKTTFVLFASLSYIAVCPCLGQTALTTVATQTAATASSTAGPTATQPLPHGAVGVGTYATVAQFKELQVSAAEQVLLHKTLSEALTDFDLSGGGQQWKVLDNVLQQSGTDATGVNVFVGEKKWTDYTVSVKARKVSGKEGFSLSFRALDSKNFACFNVGGWGNTKAQFGITIAGTFAEIGSSTDMKVEEGRWYDIKVEVAGNEAIGYVDGKKVAWTQLTAPPPKAANASNGRGRGNPQVAPDSPATIARRNAIDSQLKSGEDAKIRSGLADLKKWFVDNAAEGENTAWRLRLVIMSLGGYKTECQEIIDLAKAEKSRNPAGGVGYLYVMEAGLLFSAGKQDEAITSIKDGLKADAVNTRTALVADLAAVSHKDVAEFVDQLQKLALAMVDDPAIVEWSLKQQILALNGEGKFSDALAVNKSLFNYCSMAHTSDALLLMDRQLIVSFPDDPSVATRFHSEQSEGAIAPTAGSQPSVCSILQRIKVDAAVYEGPIKRQVDKTYQDRVRHSLLLLLADQPIAAMSVARQAFALAATSDEMTNAKELIGRCYKAQDGTIGRANAWAAGNLQVPEMAKSPGH